MSSSPRNTGKLREGYIGGFLVDVGATSSRVRYVLNVPVVSVCQYVFVCVCVGVSVSDAPRSQRKNHSLAEVKPTRVTRHMARRGIRKEKKEGGGLVEERDSEKEKTKEKKSYSDS